MRGYSTPDNKSVCVNYSLNFEIIHSSALVVYGDDPDRARKDSKVQRTEESLVGARCVKPSKTPPRERHRLNETGGSDPSLTVQKQLRGIVDSATKADTSSGLQQMGE